MEKPARRVKKGDVFLDGVKTISPSIRPCAEDYCVEMPPHHTVIVNGGLVMVNCDGDEDSILLALDSLINFSQAYLPEKIGGIMDAPIMLSESINLNEIQRQALEMDVDEKYPLELYAGTFTHEQPRKIVSKIRLVENLLNKAEKSGFSIPTSNITLGNRMTVYSLLPTMPEKITAQFDLMDRLEGVDSRDVALKVLTTHFLRDIIGNLRAFTVQTFRCKSCNRKYRRPPITGKCPACNGELAPTVHRGGIEKYLTIAEDLITKYNLPNYYLQRIQLVRDEINLLFGPREEEKQPFKQESLADFV